MPVDEANQPLAFQTLSTRKRVDVTERSVDVRVRLICFDLLWLGDQDLTRRPLSERRSLLKGAFGLPESEPLPERLAVRFRLSLKAE